ncbi:MAG: glycoside hydrolase family 16 protein [Kiritimatiellaeota bacterium]|nr:glycoside hydrolase family 16 protein [Kiritimatiellota bacterium]
MKKTTLKITALVAAALAATSLPAQVQTKTIVDFGAAGFSATHSIHTMGSVGYELIPSSKNEVKINVAPENGWPGFYVSFPGEYRNLGDYGGVSIDVYNPSDVAQSLGFRVDNPGAGMDGSKHYNAFGYTVKPGERKTLSVWFGFNGMDPGFPLDTANITGICLFWNQPNYTASLIVRDIKAIPPHPDLLGVAKPREKILIDFESNEILYKTHGGEIIEGANVIGGKRSLMGDTAKSGGLTWFEFWESRQGLLAGSYNYNVKFQYRIIESDDNAKLYSFFRSQGKGWGKWDRGWTEIGQLPAKKGQILTQEYTVGLPRFKDYALMFGITGGHAKVVIDNIEITRGEPNNEGDLLDRAVAKRNAAAERLFLVDFEGQLPPTARIHIGEVSDKTAEALIGKKSLVVDTIGRAGEWHTVFTLGRGKLEPGYKYHITVPVRMVKKGDRGANVYIAAAPLNEGENNGKIGWRSWNSGEDEDDVISTTFAFREDRGYEFLIGVYKGARVIFDEIEIRREKLPPDVVPTLKVRDPKNMKLVFEDNFDGDKIDESKWTIGGDGPHRGGVLRKANSQLDGDGHYEMLFNPDGGTFACAALNSQGKHEFKYGYFECRAQLNKHEGHWFGFWLTGNGVNAVTGDGRGGTEVDIVEAPWRYEDKVSHALHWDGYGDDHATDGFAPKVPGIQSGWHTYALDWQPEGYIFLIDGKETWRTDSGGVCQVPLWIILSDELGGWSGNPWGVDKSLFPDKILVDYVRVWQ